MEKKEMAAKKPLEFIDLAAQQQTFASLLKHELLQYLLMADTFWDRGCRT